MGPNQLQGLSLGMPGALRLALAGCLQIGGQGASGSHGPHPRCRPGFCADYGTVSAGEQARMAFHPQAAIGEDSAIAIQR